MVKERISLILVLILIQLSPILTEFRRVCYYTDWSQYRPGRGAFLPENIDPSLCTNILYAYAQVLNRDLIIFDDTDAKIDDRPGLYSRVIGLKALNPNLRVSLSIGGANAGSYQFTKVTKSKATMNTFAMNVVRFLKKWKFDGLVNNLKKDWQSPLFLKSEFTQLLQTLRDTFDRNSFGDERLLLSIAVSARIPIIDNSYEIENISKIVDFIDLQAYDMQGSSNDKIGFSSPLYASSSQSNWERSLNADYAVKYLIKKGCPKEKLILGIALHGRGYTLASTYQNTLGSPASGPSYPGSYLQIPGYFTYYEICSLLSKNKSIKKFDDSSKSPSLQIGTQWISHEDIESIVNKAYYIKSKCLGGFMIWSLDLDDFDGTFCSQGKYPLLSALNNILKYSNCPRVETTVKTTTSTTSASTTTTTTTTSTTTTSTTTPTSPIGYAAASNKASQTQFSTESNFNTNIFSTSGTTRNWFLPFFTIPTNIFISSTSTLSTTVSKPEINFSNDITCDNLRLLPIPGDCKSFRFCFKNLKEGTKIINCPPGLWFDPDLSTCVAYKPKSCLTENYIPTIKTTTPLTTPSTTPSTTQYIYPDPFKFFNPPIKFDSFINNKKEFECSSQSQSGMFKDSDNCRKYWQCSNGRAFHMDCPPGLYYNENINNCDYDKSSCEHENISFEQTSPLESYKCIKDGLYKDPNDCNKFWICSNGKSFEGKCQTGLEFDYLSQRCLVKSSSC